MKKTTAVEKRFVGLLTQAIPVSAYEDLMNWFDYSDLSSPHLRLDFDEVDDGLCRPFLVSDKQSDVTAFQNKCWELFNIPALMEIRKKYFIDLRLYREFKTIRQIHSDYTIAQAYKIAKYMQLCNYNPFNQGL